MLCSSKINHRPDKILQKSFIKLAIALITLSLSVLCFFVLPQYILYTAIITIIVTILCFILTIKTLNAGEAAISYGGFANEIINQSNLAERIENPDMETIIQNEKARDLLTKNNVLTFLRKYAADGTNNQAALSRLENAIKNLSTEKVVISLLRNPQSLKIFDELEYMEVSLAPIYLKKTKIFNHAFSVKRIAKETYFHWSIDDITSRRNIDETIKSELNYLHDFLDDLPIGLYRLDKDGVISYVNNDFANFIGQPVSNLVGKTIKQYLKSDNTLPIDQNEWFGRLSFITKDQLTADAYVFQTAYRQNEKTYLRGAIIHNLPSLVTTNDDINRSMDEINRVFKNFPVGIMFIDRQGNIINHNDKAAQMLFGSISNISNLFLHLSNETSEQLTGALNKVCSSDDSINIEIKQNNKILNLHINSLQDVIAAKNKEEFIIYIFDVSRQKSLEMQFAQAQKMQAVGQFAGGVAHDFNNLLTAILGFTEFLLQKHGLGDPSFADLIQIKQNTHRATALVRQLLAFSRQQPLIPRTIDVTDSFADLNSLLKRSIIGEKIKLIFNHGNNLGFIKVDPNQFAQVIVNLAINAKDAMNGEGTLTISTRTEHLAEKYAFGDEIIMPGDFVVIDVSDTGCGIAPENLPRIFDPFFTTKEPSTGSGTGLGLAMVYGIVRQTEGFIKVASTLGKGTTFSIYLPRFEKMDDELTTDYKELITDKQGQPILKVQETIPTPADVNQKMIMGLNVSNTIDRSHIAVSVGDKPAKILFVEDEASVRALGVRVLKKKGYNVVESDSAENALEILQDTKDFDLLVTDMVLPGLSGAQLTNKVKEILPNLPVILASGYSEDIARKEVNNLYDFEFLAKPYSLTVLTEKIFSVLNNRHDK